MFGYHCQRTKFSWVSSLNKKKKKDPTEALLYHTPGKSCSEKLFEKKVLKLFKSLFLRCISSWNPFSTHPPQQKLVELPHGTSFLCGPHFGNAALSISTLGFWQTREKSGKIPMPWDFKRKVGADPRIPKYNIHKPMDATQIEAMQRRGQGDWCGSRGLSEKLTVKTGIRGNRAKDKILMTILLATETED